MGICFMMATKAFNRSGEDLGREKPALCVISEEEKEVYTGSWFDEWLEGYGHIYVRFPKETTREPTKEEIAIYSNAIRKSS